MANDKGMDLWKWHLLELGGYFHGIVQARSNSSLLAIELLQSCAKPSI